MGGDWARNTPQVLGQVVWCLTNCRWYELVVSACFVGLVIFVTIRVGRALVGERDENS